MRARLSVSALVAIVLVLCCGPGSAGEFTTVPVTTNVTPTVSESAAGLGAAKGATGFGSANAALTGGEHPAATVDVNVNVNLNTSWYGQSYTNKDGTAATNPCFGSRFQLDKAYIQAHEMEHVGQIRTAVSQFFADNGVMYQASSGAFKFRGAVTNASDIQGRINDFVRDEVNKMTEADQAEYAARDAGGSLGPLEGGARAASCTEFMNAVGNNLLGIMRDAATTIADINGHLKDAQKQADTATSHAANALAAAKAALAAAEKCDWDAFKKALDRYVAQVAAALAALDASKGALDEANDADHAGHLRNLAAQYDAAKQAAGVLEFKAKLEAGKGDTADGVRAEIDKTLQKLQAQTAAIGAQNAATRAALKRAKDLMDKAWEALLKCFKVGDPNYGPATDAHDRYERAGASPTPSPSPAPSPPASRPTDPPLGTDPQFKSEEPRPGDGGAPERGAYLPPIAGPGSEIVATVIDDTEAGPHSFVVATVGSDGHRSFWRGVTDALGRLHLRVPEGAVALELFRHFDRAGVPDEGARCNIGSLPHLPGTEAVPGVAGSSPSVLEGDVAYQRGDGDGGLFALHTRGNDPLDTHILIDGKPDVTTLASSDTSTLGTIGGGTALGRHSFALESDGKRSNAFAADVVTLTPEPVPPSVTGAIDAVRVHVEGLPAGDSATMDFAVSGSSTLVTGGSTTTVPVKNGLAEVRIRGIHAGQAIVRFHLAVTLGS